MDNATLNAWAQKLVQDASKKVFSGDSRFTGPGNTRLKLHEYRLPDGNRFFEYVQRYKKGPWDSRNVFLALRGWSGVVPESLWPESLQD